jgi:cysteinyl-tRNA synthetase
MVFDILGLQEEQEAGSQKLDGLMELLLELRAQAKVNKDWATSDAIRDRLANLGIQVKDSKTGSSWTLS